MKTYREVAVDVFRKGDALLEQKKKQKERIKTGAALAAITAVVLLSAFGIAKSMMTRQKPAVLPASSGVLVSDSTAPSGKAPSKPEPNSDHASAQVTSALRTTAPRTPSSQTTEAPHSGKMTSEKPAASDASAFEKTTAAAGEPRESEPSAEPDTTQALTTEPEPTNEPTEAPVTEPGEEPTSDADQTTLSGRADNPGKASPYAPRRNYAAMLHAAKQNNAYGWLRLQGRDYVQDDRANTSGIEIGEKIGETGDFAGNLDSLGLAGDVFSIEGETDQNRLLLQTADGRKLIFVSVGDAN